jgi:hypothetical protein
MKFNRSRHDRAHPRERFHLVGQLEHRQRRHDGAKLRHPGHDLVGTTPGSKTELGNQPLACMKDVVKEVSPSSRSPAKDTGGTLQPAKVSTRHIAIQEVRWSNYRASNGGDQAAAPPIDPGSTQRRSTSQNCASRLCWCVFLGGTPPALWPLLARLPAGSSHTPAPDRQEVPCPFWSPTTVIAASFGSSQGVSLSRGPQQLGNLPPGLNRLGRIAAAGRSGRSTPISSHSANT